MPVNYGNTICNAMPSTLDSDNTFVDWLVKQLDNRGWSPAELARRSGVYQSVISNVLNREKSLGVEVARKIAKALDVSQADLFRRAGLIDDPLLDDDQAAREYLRLLSAIEDDDERQAAIDTVETILRRVAARRKESGASGARNTSRAKGTA